ncbi:MAG: PAS domain S-box protein [Pseudomonadota bacterium]
MCESLVSVENSFDVVKPFLHAIINDQDYGDRHQRMLDNLIEGIIIVDNLGRIIQSNAPMVELSGYTMDEIGNQNISTFLSDHELKIFRRDLTRRGQGRNFRKEMEICRKDGTKLQTVMQISPLENITGNPGGLFISVMDITRRKHTEEILKKTEEKYRNIFENAIDGIFQITPDGRILSANSALARIFGYASPKELIHSIKKIGDQIFVDTGRYHTLRMLLQKKDTVHDFEFRALHKSGREIWACENVRAVRNEKKQLLYHEGTIRDITSRKGMEDQLLQSQKMEAIGRLAGGIAHDFNNILTTIMGNAELALHQLTPQNSVHKRIEVIVETAERAAQLTRQLLTISRKQVISPVILNVNDAVENVGKILDRLLGEDVQCDIIPGSSIQPIRADACQIEQVILNLAVNARDAMPNGGKLNISTATVRLDQDYCRKHPEVISGDYAMISVSDTGTGIPGASMEHIFEPFYTTKAAGTGLGLSIVYGIVKQCGGHITIASTVGVGSSFKVYFPCVAETEKKPEQPTPAPEVGMPSGKETILIVEDEAFIRELMCDILYECGYTVHSAATAEEALKGYDCDGIRIDLLISDVILPGKRGPDLAEELKARLPGIKVIFVSGYSDDRIRHSDILEGRAHFLPKPFTPVILAKKVREILGPHAIATAGI